MSLRVEVAEGRAAIEEFVRFHDRVYADRGAFVPVFPALEIPFAAGKGPLALDRRIRPFVARQNGEIVARVLAVLDHRYQRHWDEPLGHLVKFEALPRQRAAVQAVMHAACGWLAEAGAKAARCGMGPLDMPFVTDAYTALPPGVLRFNPPYYHALLKEAGFETEHGFVDYRATVDPGLIVRWQSAVTAAEHGGFRLAPLREVPAGRRAEVVTTLHNDTFQGHWGFSPMVEAEQAMYLAFFEPLGVLDTSAIAYRDEEPVGLAIAVPETSGFAALAPGRTLGPEERLNWLVVGVRARTRGAGLGTALASYAFLELIRRGATHLSYTLVLDDNWPSRRTANKLGAEVCANYVCYRRNLR